MKSNRTWSKSIAMAGTAVLFTSMAMAQAPPTSQANTPNAMPNGTSPNNAPGNQRIVQDEMNGVNNNPGSQAALDKMFVRKALQGGMAEVQLGQLAAQKGSSDSVKSFGQKMVDDHTKLGNEMKPIAQKLNVAVPTKLDVKDQALYTKLQAMSGTDFDTAYVKAMLKDHKKDDAEFKTEAQNAADPDLKATVTAGEKVISQHLQMIESIAKTNNVASK